MFNISDNKGFHITFDNGWTVSVQWGRGNYSDNYSLMDYTYGDKVPPSSCAEIAAWNEEKEWHKFENGDTVAGYKNAEDVFNFMSMVKEKQ